MAARPRLLGVVALLLAGGTAAAHDSQESTASFWIRPTGIDVQVYMSRGSADALVAKEGESVTVVRSNFGDFEKRLGGIGPGLLIVTGGDGGIIACDASAATLTEEDDICFRLHFPLPRGLPGVVAIHGVYLDKMLEGHVGSIYVLDAENDPLATGEIRAEAPDFDVHVPGVGALFPGGSGGGNAATATAALPVGSVMNAETGAHWGGWALLGGAALLAAIVAGRAVGGRKGKTNRGS